MATVMNLAQSAVISLSGLIVFLADLQQAFESKFTNECVCPGDTLTYECTVMGGLLTVWTGNAFICPSYNDEVALLHSRFSLAYGTNRSCNNGAIVGQSLSVKGNNYTSQLNVTVTPDIAGKTVMCDSDNGETTMLIFSLVIPSTGPFPPPDGFNFSKNSWTLNEVTFSWSPIAPDCPAIHYNILASNCGSCPTTTNHTNVTCTDVPTNDSMCNFAVQTVVCGNITGNASDRISITTEPTVTTQIGILHSTENQGTYNSSTTQITEMNNLATGHMYIISFSSLAMVMIVVAAVSLTVIVAVLKRNKAKTPDVFNRAEGTTPDQPMHKNVAGPLHSVSEISTQDNVAYGQTRTVAATQKVPMYEDVTGPLPSVSAIDTKNNIAYGYTHHH